MLNALTSFCKEHCKNYCVMTLQSKQISDLLLQIVGRQMAKALLFLIQAKINCKN